MHTVSVAEAGSAPDPRAHADVINYRALEAVMVA